MLSSSVQYTTAINHGGLERANSGSVSIWRTKVHLVVCNGTIYHNDDMGLYVLYVVIESHLLNMHSILIFE